MLHRGHVILRDRVQHVADEQVLVGMPHRQQRRAIVAFHGHGRHSVKQGRGGVYRHFSDGRLLSSFHIRKRIIVISDSPARYRHFDYAWRAASYRQSGFTLSSLWIRFFVIVDSPACKNWLIYLVFSNGYKITRIP